MFDILNKFSTLITLVMFFITAVGVYWKLKIEITQIQVELEMIKTDRKQKWEEYEKIKEKQFTIYDNLNKCLSGVSGDIKEIKNDLSWIKEKNLK